MEQLGYIPSREQLPLTVMTPEADYEILEMEDRVIPVSYTHLEEAGLPARSAIGTNALPGGIACDIEVLVELE